MKREMIKRILATLMLVIIIAVPVAAGVTAAGNGNTNTHFIIDWTNVELTESGRVVPYFAVLKSEDGYYFYMISNTEYDTAYCIFFTTIRHMRLLDSQITGRLP